MKNWSASYKKIGASARSMLGRTNLLMGCVIISASMVGEASADKSKKSSKKAELKITEVVVTYGGDSPSCSTADHITITGKNFNRGRPPVVTLGEFGDELEICEFPTKTQIIAQCPGGFCSTAGDFLLRVSTGKSKKHNDSYDLTIGAIGPEGVQGPRGVDGTDGIDGIAGAQGAMGEAGLTGSQGPQGPQGPQGLVGLTGTDGADGIAGAQGATGEAGPIGPQGPTGPTGAEGPVGVGLTGAIGADGPQGAIGPMGAAGPQGPVGPEGAGGGVAQYTFAQEGGIPTGSFNPLFGSITFTGSALLPFGGNIIAATTTMSGLDVGDRVDCTVTSNSGAAALGTLQVFSPGRSSDIITGSSAFDAGDFLSVDCEGSTNGNVQENLAISVIVQFNL